MTDPALIQVRSISKSFGPVQALSAIHADFWPGEVHAVLGENGAGKSTLMSILAGFLRPDQGSVTLGAKPLAIGNPAKIRESGVAMVHQHFMLVPEFSVLENLMLDQLGGLKGRLDPRPIQERATRILEDFGWNINLSAKISLLPVGVQQRVEILKALCTQAKVLILDEPTAVLSEAEIDDLFQVIRQLKQKGVAVVLIAHKLREVYAIADRCTVLRKGLLIGSSPITELTNEELAKMMVGEEVPPLGEPPAVRRSEAPLAAEDLWISGDRGEDSVKGASLTVHRGEILGIAGVDGNGQLELAEALAGVRPLKSGSIARPNKTQYIPQDRQRDGLALSMSIEENLLISGFPASHFDRFGLLSKSKIRAWSQSLAGKFQVKYGSLDDPMRSLSGGNQQKILIARSFEQKPEFIILMNPTRGLDVKATAFVHQQIQLAAQEGSAVVLISSDRDELAALCHRCLAMSSGRLSESTLLSYLGASS